MNRPFYPAVGVLTLLALSACSTVENPPPPPAPPLVKIAIPSPPPLLGAPAAGEAPPAEPPVSAAARAWTPRPGGAADRALRAQAVYLARPHQIGELEHLMITEVWRHDPALGPAPEIGSEWMPGQARPPMKGAPDYALICLSATPRGHTTTIATFRAGRLVPEGVPLAELRSAVQSGHPDAIPERRFPPGPQVDEAVAEAEEIYLVRAAPGDDGSLAYHLSEVWRHTRPGPAPALDAVLPQAGRLPVGGPGIASGDAAVVFLFPERALGETGRHVRRLTVMVHNGYVWGTVSLSDLYQRVVASSPARPTE